MLCARFFLTPRAEKRKAEEEETEKKKKKMKKEESVATVINVQALEEEVDQPRNAAFQQPQFSLPPLDSCQPHQPQLQQQQPHNYAYQQQLLPNVGNQPHQPQIFIVSLDSFNRRFLESHWILRFNRKHKSSSNCLFWTYLMSCLR